MSMTEAENKVQRAKKVRELQEKGTTPAKIKSYLIGWDKIDSFKKVKN